jgi:tetratricopeptide (TPR) repeat protein
LRGREDYEKFYRYDARKYLEKAIELDSTFAMAYAYLAEVYASRGYLKARVMAYEKAKQYAHKATEKERLYIEAAYAAWVEKNQEKGLQILKSLAEKYPKEKRVHHFLAVWYSIRNLFREALEEYTKTLELDPNFGPGLNDLGYAYSNMGDFEKALEYFERYASVSPGDANPFDSMAEIYFKMGKLDQALVKFKEALAARPDFEADWKIAYVYMLKEEYDEAIKWAYYGKSADPADRAFYYYTRAFYESWRGRFKQSLIHLDKAVQLADSTGSPQFKFDYESLRGWIYYELSNLPLAQRSFGNGYESGVKSNPARKANYATDYDFQMGMIKIKQGQVDSARARLAEIKPRLAGVKDAERLTFNSNLLLAEALIAEDSVDKAISVAERMTPDFPYGGGFIFDYSYPFLRDVLARAHKQKGKLDKAIAEYERLITFDPNQKDRRLIHPKYHYRLAKLYEEKGRTGKASEQYEKFLELWKNADSGLPEVIDAKARLVKMRGAQGEG